MTEPYSLETILSELGDKSDAWVLQDKATGFYVTIPHPKYPGKNLIHFFISKDDAQSVLLEIIDVNEKLKPMGSEPMGSDTIDLLAFLMATTNATNGVRHD